MRKLKVLKRLYGASDILLLISGMASASIGIFFIYMPAGLIAIGSFMIALAFFIANKQAKGG